MGYQVRYSLTITPRPDLTAIQRLGSARRSCERAFVGQSDQITTFFAEPINEAIYQALGNEKMVFALGRGLAGGGEPDSQWHEHESDMRNLSAAAPEHLFTLDLVGEDSDDRRRKYFKRGLMQEARARIEFDAFDEAKLA